MDAGRESGVFAGKQSGPELEVGGRRWPGLGPPGWERQPVRRSAGQASSTCAVLDPQGKAPFEPFP